MPEILVFDDTLAYRTIKMDGFNAVLGEVGFGELSAEEWRFYLDIEDRHANIGGVCHGGALLTLVDIGMGAAAFRVSDMSPVATISLESQFVAAARPGNRAHGRSRLVRAVKKLVFMESEIWSRDRLVMRASGIWKVLDRPHWRDLDPAAGAG